MSYFTKVYVPQYPTWGSIETMREYLEIRSDKSILSNSLCDFATIILKNDYFENGELKYHQNWDFFVGSKFASPYSNLFMAELGKIIFQNSEVKPFLWLR